jgi:hypothetical protein
MYNKDKVLHADNQVLNGEQFRKLIQNLIILI